MKKITIGLAILLFMQQSFSSIIVMHYTNLDYIFLLRLCNVSGYCTDPQQGSGSVEVPPSMIQNRGEFCIQKDSIGPWHTIFTQGDITKNSEVFFKQEGGILYFMEGQTVNAENQTHGWDSGACPILGNQ